MEVGTKQSKTAVNSGAGAADPMKKLDSGAVAGQSGSWEDLGGPTPENYKPDDNSAMLKTPGSTLKQVRDVVNKSGGSADAMQKLPAGWSSLFGGALAQLPARSVDLVPSAHEPRSL